MSKKRSSPSLHNSPCIYLSRVTWPRFYDDLSRLPSLAFTASRLQSITCWYGSAAEEILWVWVTTRKLPSSEHNSVVGYQIKDQYPAITIGDAAVIGKFIAQIAGLDWIMSMSWEPSREGQRCVSLLLSLDMLSLGRIWSIFWSLQIDYVFPSTNSAQDIRFLNSNPKLRSQPRKLISVLIARYKLAGLVIVMQQ